MENKGQESNRNLWIGILIVAFVLAFLWENLHSGLYKNYSPIMHDTRFIICTIGDVLLTFIIYCFGYLIFKNPRWILHHNKNMILTTLALSILLSFLAEKTALILELWEYKEAMPIIPYLKIGLSPFLGISLLPLISFYLTKKIVLFF